MAEKIVMRHQCADYIDIGTTAEPDVRLMDVFEQIDENYGVQTMERPYVSRKSSVKMTTGYQTSFPYKADIYEDEEVAEYLQAVGEEQQVNVTTDFIRVKLWKPIASKENTYYARKFRVAVEPTSTGGAGGEAINTSGNLNAISDVVIGEFNTTTKAFTAASAAAVSNLGG